MSTRQGVIILDTERTIRVVSPGAEDLLGWRSAQITGLRCSVVLDCRDADGRSLCETCAAAQALSWHEVTPTRPAEVADPAGERRSVTSSFWYLPPSGTITEERLLLVLNRVEEAAGNDHRYSEQAAAL